MTSMFYDFIDKENQGGTGANVDLLRFEVIFFNFQSDDVEFIHIDLKTVSNGFD